MEDCQARFITAAPRQNRQNSPALFTAPSDGPGRVASNMALGQLVPGPRHDRALAGLG